MGAPEKKWFLALFFAAFISVSLLLGNSYSYFRPSFPSKIIQGPTSKPAFAYYISGGHGDVERIFRLLLAVYHPRNHYLLHIGTEGTATERLELANLVQSVPAVKTFKNVDVMGKPDRRSFTGATNILATLHAASMLLKLNGRWDWFIALDTADYPLLTQDDLIDVFSSIPRGLNFIDHTSNLGWKEGQRIHPLVVDPGIYLKRRTQIFHATQKRPTPDAFKVFTGSPWVVLSRDFMEFCIVGWVNLPRTLLMYVNNAILPQEVYFHSVICNTRQFKNTTVNSDLRFMIWDKPHPKMHPTFLTPSNFDQMTHSGAAFARRFHKDDPVLDMVDEEILKRGPNRAAPGAWCKGRKNWWMDPCAQWTNVNVLKPGPQAFKFRESIANLLNDVTNQTNQCQ